MTIPKYLKLLTTVLQSLADGQEWRARDFYQHVIDGLDFPEQERTEKCGGGGSSDGDPAVDQRSLAVPSGAGPFPGTSSLVRPQRINVAPRLIEK
jgi:hypothetical protein